jgi:hypothetical protein
MGLRLAGRPELSDCGLLVSWIRELILGIVVPPLTGGRVAGGSLADSVGAPAAASPRDLGLGREGGGGFLESLARAGSIEG